MWAKLLDFLRRVVDKRICTVEDFDIAVKAVREGLDADKDGFVSIKECGKALVRALIYLRK